MPATAAKSQTRFKHASNPHHHKLTLSEFKAEVDSQSKRVAEQAEKACHLRGNINGPDLDEFEEKLKLCDFA